MFKATKRFLRKYEAQIIIVAIVLLIFNPFSRAFFKTTLLITDLVPNMKIKPLSVFSKEPILREVSYKSGKGEIYADLYIPDSHSKHPAVVLNIGLDIDKRDPRISRLAESLSRSGVVVLVPNIPTISQRRLTRESPQEFEDSFKYLTNLSVANQEKLGFFTFCGASGPAFISAQRPSIKDKVDFFVTIDPYYDLKDLYKEVSLRKIEGEKWIPHAKTVEIFNREAIFQLENEEDKQKLSELLVSISEKELVDGTYKKVDTNETFITPETRVTYLELTNTNPEKANYYLSTAPEKQKEYLRDLSPSIYVKDFRPKTFILSERPSPYLPYTHAKNLHKSLDGSVLEIVNFSTTDPDPRIGAIDTGKSFYFLWRVLLEVGA